LRSSNAPEGGTEELGNGPRGKRSHWHHGPWHHRPSREYMGFRVASEITDPALVVAQFGVVSGRFDVVSVLNLEH
jgi:hypothetical protein